MTRRMEYACIRGIAYALPETLVTNDDLRREHPQWNMDRIEKRTGVRRRFVARAEETARDLAQTACQRLFAAHADLPAQIDGILFCTESPDHPIPPNACVLHGRLGLAEHVLALDVDLGCSGYPHCLALARGLIASGMASHLLVVTADTYSKFMDPEDQAVRVLFGDGAAATWVAADTEPGIVDIQCGTAGAHYDKFIIPSGGCRLNHCGSSSSKQNSPDARPRAADKIQMDGAAILAFSNTKIPPHVRELLQRSDLSVEDVDLFVFHQASQMVLDRIARLLQIKPEQMFSNLAEVGNTVSASIPIALKDALEQGRLAPGQTVVLSGFGVGLSWASARGKWR